MYLLSILAGLILFRYWAKSFDLNYRYGIETKILHLKNQLTLVGGEIKGEYKEEGIEILDARINQTLGDINRISLFFILTKTYGLNADDEQIKEYTTRVNTVLDSDIRLRSINDELCRNVAHLIFGSSLSIQLAIRLSKLILFFRSLFPAKAEKTVFYNFKQRVSNSIHNYENCLSH
ncbi:MAG: hypothetical protein JNL13_07800 [Chitinophagaceae bacterium]|nr:hypothetical protein [Chitinophagaceae bacterium]